MVIPPSAATKVLVIDEVPRRRAALTATIRGVGLTPRTVRSLADAAVQLVEESFTAVVMVCDVQGNEGFPALQGLLSVDPGLRVLVVDSHASPARATHFLKHGAWNYLAYPGPRGALRHLLNAVRLDKRHCGTEGDELLVTRSADMRRLLAEVCLAARSAVPILIRGESGTGKDLLASAIHEWSPRRLAQRVFVTCAQLPSELVMGDVFGDHGTIEQAEGGTLVLKEIGELPMSIQAQVVRLLQDSSYQRLGESGTHHANVRVVATSSRDLLQLVSQGRFRQDLYDCLAVLEFEVPALRQRRQDIMPLAQVLLDRLGGATVLRRSIGADCREKLLAHPWPGNVRQLANVVQRAALLSSEAVLKAADFPDRQTPVAEERPWVGGSFTLQQVGDEHIRRIIKGSPTIGKSAEILGIRLSTLWHWRQRSRIRNAAPISLK